MSFRMAAAAGIVATCAFAAFPAAAQDTISCNLFSEVRSLSPPAPGVEVNFVNSSDGYRTVYFVTAEGELHFTVGLEVGQSAVYAVSPGDVFAMVDRPGNCTEMFRVTQNQSLYSMRAIATGAGGD